MLDSSGHPANAFNTIISTLICYLVNSLTPRLGEIARCSVLLKTDKVPIPTGLGTVVSERVIDTLVLFGGVGVIFLMEVDRLGELFAGIMNSLFGATSGQSILVLVLLGMTGLAVAFFGYRYLQKHAGSGIARKVYGFVHTMINGARSVFKLEKPWLFFFHTFMIWFLLVLMNYFFMLSLPDTKDLGMYVALLILFIGGIGWALPVPGGMGTTHYIILQLFVAFELSETAGQNIGLLSNGSYLYFHSRLRPDSLGIIYVDCLQAGKKSADPRHLTPEPLHPILFFRKKIHKL